MAFKPVRFNSQPENVVAEPLSPSTVTIEQHTSENSVVAINGNSLQNTVVSVVETHKKELIECGLSPENAISQTVSQLSSVDVYSPHGIETLGKNASQKISSYSDEMLKHVRCKDLEEMGSSLTEVVGLAKGVDIQGLIGEGGIFSRVVAKFRHTKEKILAHFNTVNKQLDRLVKEVDKQQSTLRNRSTQLDSVFEYNINEYKELSLTIIYGESKKQLIQERINELSQTDEAPLSPFRVQEINDLQDTFNRVEKRVHDLKSLQILALQTAPMIRMVQSNNISLIEKFDNIKMLTIPSWKKQFTLAISMLEQKKSIAIANKIDDTTNDLIRKNADMLRQNTLQAARASQRSIVDIETLEHVQSTLISTLQDVVAIEQEGARNRQAADQKMVSMRTELSNIIH